MYIAKYKEIYTEYNKNGRYLKKYKENRSILRKNTPARD